jgi:hypothetical protein
MQLFPALAENSAGPLKEGQLARLGGLVDLHVHHQRPDFLEAAGWGVQRRVVVSDLCGGWRRDSGQTVAAAAAGGAEVHTSWLRRVPPACAWPVQPPGAESSTAQGELR